MDNFFDNQRILKMIWKRKFHFIIVGIAAIALSAIFSGPAFITPKFKSTARVYPTSNIAVYSDESRTEQLLEIINSRDIKFRMFDAFNLDEVYNVDKNSPQYTTFMLDKYNTNVSASKTEYETVEIKVMDEDPARASNMCDSIISFVNEKIRELHSLKHIEVIQITKEHLAINRNILDSIRPIYQSLRDETGILSYQKQLGYVTEGYMLSLSENKGNTNDGKKIEKQLNQFRQKGLDAYRLERLFSKYNNAVDSLKSVIEVEQIEAKKRITYSHVVEYPFPADKKAYPVRWLIVAFTTLSAVFFALLVFLVLDYGKKD
ncbi:Wzz/FepE/Etk N-terminal domain-containing protein [uncultured Draconibacterium sp.]|uniref:Wzz/FepE/Etk N-terminal domain-containing protein n=1 Tax=uncultured Draconibacterium sp. TaxID=1573823 RepID=UPI0025DFF1B3|nr:Wzz/FepE/Etk N-terminal domain-containing protein [uncultured Draconibacterium sp.]